MLNQHKYLNSKVRKRIAQYIEKEGKNLINLIIFINLDLLKYRKYMGSK
jgi:hypothetical protein